MSDALVKVVHDARTVSDELKCGLVTEQLKRTLFNHR